MSDVKNSAKITLLKVRIEKYQHYQTGLFQKKFPPQDKRKVKQNKTVYKLAGKVVRLGLTPEEWTSEWLGGILGWSSKDYMDLQCEELTQSFTCGYSVVVSRLKDEFYILFRLQQFWPIKDVYLWSRTSSFYLLNWLINTIQLNSS